MAESFTHEFDELELEVDGRKVLLNGTFEVGFTMQGPDKDVGIFSSYCEDVWCEGVMHCTMFDIETESLTAEFQLNCKHETFCKVMEKLDDYLRQKAAEQEPEYPEYEREDY